MFSFPKENLGIFSLDPADPCLGYPEMADKAEILDSRELASLIQFRQTHTEVKFIILQFIKSRAKVEVCEVKSKIALDYR